MTRYRRAAFSFVRLDDSPVPDIPALLRGAAVLQTTRRFSAISILRRAEFPLTAGELTELLAVPGDRWADEDELGVDSALLRALAEHGLVVCDESNGELAELRRLDDLLATTHWHPTAALFHFSTRWRDVGLEFAEVDVAQLEDAVLVTATEYQPPDEVPGHFYSRADAIDVRELPAPRLGEPLTALLAARRTTRAFDPRFELPLEQLATVLHAVYGFRGFVELADGITALSKTSPSGGALHAIEAYPLALRVDGLDPGLYHYRVGDHALELVARLDPPEAQAAAVELTAGQVYLRDASVLILMAARFERTFWKYRRHDKAYQVLLMDAAHLSQTLYLVCAELGLGACLTAALNDVNAEALLGADGVTEGVLAISAIGRRLERASPLEPEFKPCVAWAAV